MGVGVKEIIQNKDGHWEFKEMEIFKPFHFRSGHLNKPETYVDAHKASEIANEILREYLESCPVVWGTVGSVSSSWHSEKPGTYIQENYTHKARLICIEEIVKECKRHEPANIRTQWNPLRGEYDLAYPIHQYGGLKCIHCGVQLIPEWKAVDGK